LLRDEQARFGSGHAAFCTGETIMKKILLATVALTSAFAAPASALGMTGLTVTITHAFPDASSINWGPMSFTVGTTLPLSYFGIGSVSVGASSFTIHMACGNGCSWVDGSFNGFWLDDAYSVLPAFTSATIGAGTSYVGFNASRLSFDADTVYVNLESLTANGDIVIDINGSAPEPASWALMITGFGMIGAAQRRRQIALAA
jgi:hypothetical protein